MAGHVARMGEVGNVFKLIFGQQEGKIPRGVDRRVILKYVLQK